MSMPAERILLCAAEGGEAAYGGGSCAAEGGEAADGVLGGASGSAAPSKAAALATLRERHGEVSSR